MIMDIQKIEAYKYFCGECKKDFIDVGDIRQVDVFCSHCGSTNIFYSKEAYESQHDENGNFINQ